MSANFEVGDLVWAKMRGYSPWPGKIIAPPADPKLKKKCHAYVFFFGSENHAWIPEDCIEMHSKKTLEKYGIRKGAVFLTALKTIIDSAKDNSKYENSEKPNNENIRHHEKNVDAMKAGPSEDKNTQSNSVCPKIIVKQSLEKPAREHSCSPHQNDPTTSTDESRKRSCSPHQNDPATSTDESRKRSCSPHQNDPATSTDESRKRSYSPHQKESTTLEDESDGNAKLTYDDLFSSLRTENRYETCQFTPSRLSLPETKYYERPNSPPIDLSYQSNFMKEKKIKPTKKMIGFLGLSKIGQAIVRNLYYSGHSLIVWDQKTDVCDIFIEKFELQIAETPADVVQAADITFSCMPDLDAAMELVFGKYSILKEMEHSNTVQKGYVEMTSLDPERSFRIATEIGMRGGRYLEAPIFKSRKEADEGTLFIQAAGDETLYDDCKSCLDAITKKHSFISADVGVSTKYSIVENILTGTVYAALAESMSLAKAVGLDSKHFLNIFQDTDLNSPNMVDKLTAMENNNYTSDTSLKYMQEQLKFGLALGNEISQPTSLIATAKELYKHSEALQYGDHDVSAVFEGTKR